MSNLIQWFDIFYPTKDMENKIMEMVELWNKVTWRAKFNKNFLKKKPWLAQRMQEHAWNLLSQIGSLGVLWIPSITNVLPLFGMDNQGGYDVVHKVQIERLNHIPNTIVLGGKHPKQMINRKHTNNIQNCNKIMWSWY